ncbi:hypothetical protein CKM354_000505500 [Cercospora kikuchii]|uniref:Putative glutathione-dependent formaldehyde-activating enzyme n=1 Tax=Cercospora kikuchii TaxID=84275 RepID=A0A9P3FGR8_9PEZI|nr:uncharacterized protein CKM354_000505500 [Cercospora kikuchii]GIZ41760.1 hypothetical protein CKM354_000505500 [Cercospora kikuchii]
MSYINLHPDINNGFAKGDPNFSGGTLQCHCRSDPVKVQITGNVAHNHACGCSKCWKPDGALFSIVGVVPVDNVKVVANANKLSIIDPNAAIQRNACKQCGVHLYGRIVKDHAFKGLDFIHVELSKEQGWQEPQFAAFVSSIIEQGFDAGKMDQVRSKLKSVGLEPYDCLNPGLMDALASYTAKSKLTSGQTQAVEEETNSQRPVKSESTPVDVKGWGLLWRWLGITKTQKPKAKL